MFFMKWSRMCVQLLLRLGLVKDSLNIDDYNLDGEYCQGSEPKNQTSSYCQGQVIARVGAGQDGKIESEVRDSSNHIMKANDPVFLAGKVVSESTREYDGDTGKRSMGDAENVKFSLTQCYSDTRLTIYTDD
ncbi:hypothetical protein Tco_0028959 [Tanacetum coccineum]